jgi:hypothetical protein
MSKPSVFVGSSTEGLEFARAIRGRLVNDAEVTLWDEGFFTIGSTFIETLVNSLSRFDFAILLLTADDWVHSRNDEKFGPRDNVIFELGLFMGRLGRSRTFIVHESGAKIKLPTDLSGLTTAQYHWPRDDNNHDAAVGYACDSIRKIIRDLGFSEEKASKRIQLVAEEQERQAHDLDWMKMLIELIVSEFERMHLRSLAADGPFWADIKPGSTFEWELRHLLTLRLVDRHQNKGIRSLFSENGRRNVKDHFFITQRGIDYLRIFDESTIKGSG